MLFLSQLSRTKKIIIVSIVVILIIIGASILFSGKSGNSEEVEVVRGEISEIVRVTGKTKATSDADLAFETTGRIRSIYKKVGETVYSGEVLMVLDQSKLSADLLDAEASLEAEEASYNQAKNGTRPEQIAVSEAKLGSAQSSLEDANSQLKDKLRDAYTKSDDSVRNKADQFFDNPRISPDLNLNFSDYSLSLAVETERKDLNAVLDSLLDITTSFSGNDDLLSDSEEVKSKLTLIQKFLNDMALGVNSLYPSTTLSQTTIDGYKADILTARTNVNTALTAILTAEEKVRSASTALLVAKEDLNLLKAGSTPEELSIALSKVKQKQANVDKIKAELSKTVLRSPISGTVTKLEGEIGELAVANTVTASVIGNGGLEIEVYIPEVDIGRVAVGNKVDITVDAFPSEEFVGAISYIDPAETIVDGVVNYKATIIFSEDDSRMRSGLTVNLYIESKRNDNALIVPQFAVTETDEGIFAEKKVNGEKVKTKIEIGIRGEDGLLEVLTGLTEGDIVYNVGLKQD